MAAHKLGVLVWLLVAMLVSGLGQSFAGKWLQWPMGLIHKLLALLILVVLFRMAVPAFRSSPVLPVAFIVLIVACIAAFVTGVLQSIPAAASSLWLNLHRVSFVVAAIACGVGGTKTRF